MTTNTHSSDQPVIAENELREQISKIFVKWSLPTRQAAISEIMAAVAQAKQAWTVEARKNELEKLPKLSTPDTHKSQKYRDYGKFIYQVHLPKRLSELQTSTAESEV